MKKGDILRTCLGCRETFAKKSLVRFVESPQSELVLDYYFRLPGRGAYVCPSSTCLEKALKGNAFKRSFKGNVKLPVLGDLVNLIRSKCIERIASVLSMAVRSRKVSLGTEAVEGELKKGALSLLLLSGLLSERARSEWDRKSASKGINVDTLPETGEIDAVLGGRKVVALKDSGMARTIIGEIERLKKLDTDLK